MTACLNCVLILYCWQFGLKNQYFWNLKMSVVLLVNLSAAHETTKFNRRGVKKLIFQYLVRNNFVSFSPMLQLINMVK